MKGRLGKFKKGTNSLEFLATFPILYIAMLLVLWVAILFFFKVFAATTSTEAVSRDSVSMGSGGSFLSNITGPFNGNVGYETQRQGDFVVTIVDGSVTEDWLGWLGSRTSNFKVATFAPYWEFKP